MTMRLIWLTPLLLGAAPSPESVTLSVSLAGLRSTAGEVRVCVTHDARRFPGCKGTGGVQVIVPAAQADAISITGLAPGSYAVSVQHDENANHRLDRSPFGLPTEGVGFSRNPVLTFGPPSFKAAAVDVAAGSTTAIRMKYFL